jgi:hypothetical protein
VCTVLGVGRVRLPGDCSGWVDVGKLIVFFIHCGTYILLRTSLEGLYLDPMEYSILIIQG